MLETALREDRERFPWNEYDLTIDAESTLQLEQGMQLAFLWRNQPAETYLRTHSTKTERRG